MTPDDPADSAAREPSSARAFPIAGVGASAGGLAATTELIRALGPQPGIGVVVVHHLSPDHESGLVDILAHATAMRVETASHGAEVQPNHIYVVPPNAGLLISGGRLQLVPRIEEGGLHLPIDMFLESLAEDHRSQAIGVLLSGNGSDGSIGARAIKAAGGINFAQDASAEYRSLPDSAVAAGCIDVVLPPRAIADELRRMGQQVAPLAPRDAPSDGEEPAFRRLLLALRKASGIDFSNYKHATIRRRLQRRVFLHRMRGLEEYVQLLERDVGEATELAEEVLIHVTGFFRDPDVFRALESKVFPSMLQGRSRGAPVRVWVPGCSTGEEVYSIAICLLEHMANHDMADTPIKLFGTDVSANAIDRARLGRYAEGIAQDVSPGRLATFFARVGSSYQIRKDVREACVFARHDATCDPPFSGMDLISCRNLMIYLAPALQARTLAIFHYALRDSGFLVLGSSETIHSSPGFATYDPATKIYRRTSAAPPLLFDFASAELRGPTVPVQLGSVSTPTPLDVHREADRLVLTKFAPPGMVVTDDLSVVQFRGKTAPYLEPAPGTPSFELLRLVREELRLPLRRTIDEARSTNGLAHLAGLRLEGAEGVRIVDIDVVPLVTPPSRQRFFVVLFRDVTPHVPEAVRRAEVTPGAAAEEPPLVGQLRQELASTREYLESVIQQLESSNQELKAANEEITSSNEELRSTNEELQMAKEEIQATNEELRTVNDEMTVRTQEATRLSDDLTNVLSSVEIPIVLLGRDAKIRRYAPAAGRVLELAPGDIGRPLGDIRRQLAAASSEMAAQVLKHLSPAERTLQDETGHWYQLSARPYLTLDSRIDGTVIAAFDVDPIKRANDRLAESQRRYAREALEESQGEFRDVLMTAAEGFFMADAVGKIIFANPALAELFGYAAADELLGKSFDLLVPGLGASPTEAGDGGARRGAPLDRDRAATGRRRNGAEIALELTLRPIKRQDASFLACFVTDVTARRASERQIADYQEKLRQMAFDASLGEERERRRIAADLHDRIGQSLALAQLRLESLPKTASERPAIDETIGLIAQSIADTRTLIFDLSPPILYELGLEAALSWLAEDLEKRCGLRVELSHDTVTRPLRDATAVVLYRAVRELLTNVVKHAKATTSRVTLRWADEHLQIDVEDDGAGFDREARARDAKQGGFGLFSVREQVSRLGGTLEVVSELQHGTRVSIRLPMQANGATAGVSLAATPRAELPPPRWPA